MSDRCRSLATAVVLSALAMAAAIQAADAYKLVDGWGQLRTGDTWGEVTGVAVAPKDVIVVVRRSDPPILEFDATGKLVPVGH